MNTSEVAFEFPDNGEPSLPNDLIESAERLIEASRPVAITSLKDEIDASRLNAFREYPDRVSRDGEKAAIARLGRVARDLNEIEAFVVKYLESDAYADFLRRKMADDFWRRVTVADDDAIRIAAFRLVAQIATPQTPKPPAQITQQDRQFIATAVRSLPPELPSDKKHSIETIGEIVLVRFGTEKGVIQGKVADRLRILLNHRAVHIAELSGDLEGMAHARKMYLESDTPPSGFTDDKSAGVVVDETELRQMRSGLKKEMLRLETLPQDSPQRRELQESISARKDFISKHEGLNGRTRAPTSKAQKQRRTVEKDLNRMKVGLAGTMPKFAEHLDRSIAWNSLTDMFEYRPDPGINWEFS